MLPLHLHAPATASLLAPDSADDALLLTGIDDFTGTPTRIARAEY